MSVIIEESGLLFGEYNEQDVMHIEKTTLYQLLGGNIKSIEFALYRDKNEIIFVEAKSSSPKPGQ